MSDKASFLKAIRAAPEDDLPRLVYADWLEENGEPERAKLIREELSGLPDCPRTQFWGGLSTTLFPLVQDANYITDRGFLSSVSTSFASWVQHADSILAESVELTVQLNDIPRWNQDHNGIVFIGDCVLIPYPSDSHDEMDLGRRGIMLYYLKQRWPDVKNWALPPGPIQQGSEVIRDIILQHHQEVLNLFRVPEPDSLYQTRRHLRHIREVQRVITANGRLPSEDLEAAARHLQDEIYRHTGRRDFD